LYKEIRIENTLKDEKGNEVSLKQGAEVEVTVEAEKEATTPKSKSPEPNTYGLRSNLNPRPCHPLPHLRPGSEGLEPRAMVRDTSPTLHSMRHSLRAQLCAHSVG
jgi:hypothetical protein